MITGRRQRRNWTDEEKALILAERAESDVNISAVARRWGPNRSLLNVWRREAGLTSRRSTIRASRRAAGDVRAGHRGWRSTDRAREQDLPVWLVARSNFIASAQRGARHRANGCRGETDNPAAL